MSDREDVQGEGFEILGHKAPEAQEESAGGPETAEEVKEEELAPPEAGEVPKLDVYSVVQISVGQLTALAWQKMGLQADPFTNKIEKDIKQARLAIDIAATLVEKLLPHLGKQHARDYQNLLTDLRLNFVRQSGEQ